MKPPTIADISIAEAVVLDSKEGFLVFIHVGAIVARFVRSLLRSLYSRGEIERAPETTETVAPLGVQARSTWSTDMIR